MPSDRPPKKPSGTTEPNDSGPSALERYLAKQKLEKQKQEKLARPADRGSSEKSSGKPVAKPSLLSAFLKSPNPVAGEAQNTRASGTRLGQKASTLKPSLRGIERPLSNEPAQPASLRRWESVADLRLSDSERSAQEAGAPPIPPGPASREATARESQAPPAATQVQSRAINEILPMTDSQLQADNLRPGEFGPRFIAYMVDVCILAALLWPLRSAANLILGTITGGLVTAQSEGVDTILYFALVYAYYGYFYSTKAASPGKLLMGLEIYSPDGHTKITPWKAFFREAIGKLISTIPFLMGFIIVLIRSDRRSLHDLLFDTRVVNRPLTKALSEQDPEARL